jgi:uncharacterized protein YjiS (DUF1127 family)
VRNEFISVVGDVALVRATNKHMRRHDETPGATLVSYTESRRQYYQSRPSMNLLVVLARNILAMVQIWRARARFRRELAARSERELQDIGTCWSSIACEVSNPFWRP